MVRRWRLVTTVGWKRWPPSVSCVTIPVSTIMRFVCKGCRSQYICKGNFSQHVLVRKTLTDFTLLLARFAFFLHVNSLWLSILCWFFTCASLKFCERFRFFLKVKKLKKIRLMSFVKKGLNFFGLGWDEWRFLVRRDESPENYCHSPGVGVVVVVVVGVVVRRQKL